MVSASAWFLPVCTFPKLSDEGLAIRAPGETPFPGSGIASVTILLIRAKLPFALPADCGVNTTLKFALWFEVKVNGKLNPVTLYPEPLNEAWVIVTLDPPVLVTLSARVWVWLVCTFPKLSEEGAAESAPGVTPKPDSGMFNVGFEALLVTAIFPEAVPADCGLKLAVRETL